jgi:hypothetical protein
MRGIGKIGQFVLSTAGSIVVSSACGIAAWFAAIHVILSILGKNNDASLISCIVFCPTAAFAGFTLGAAVGAAIMQGFLRRPSSFSRVLLGALVGSSIGLLPALAALVVLYMRYHGDSAAFIPSAMLIAVFSGVGAVLGSGWRARAADAVVARPEQGVISPNETLKPQSGQAKCPFCHSTTFHVVEEAGSRRCSECHTILPS